MHSPGNRDVTIPINGNPISPSLSSPEDEVVEEDDEGQKEQQAS